MVEVTKIRLRECLNLEREKVQKVFGKGVALVREVVWVLPAIRDKCWVDFFTLGKSDVDGARELVVYRLELGGNFAKESLGNRMLDAQKVVEGCRVSLDG